MTSQASRSNLIVGNELHDSDKTRIDMAMAGLLSVAQITYKKNNISITFFLYINIAHKPKSKLKLN